MTGPFFKIALWLYCFLAVSSKYILKNDKPSTRDIEQMMIYVPEFDPESTLAITDEDYQMSRKLYLEEIERTKEKQIKQEFSSDSILIEQASPLKSWMGDNFDIFGNLTLFDLSLPGTHDTGTSYLDPDSIVVNQSPLITELQKIAQFLYIPAGHVIRLWSQSQDRTIYQQLNDGIRYLDIRAGWDGKDWKIHHGLTGITILEALAQVAQFLNENTLEVVMLEVSSLAIGKSHIPRKSLRELILASDLAPFLFLKGMENGLESTLQDFVKSNKRAVLSCDCHSKKLWGRLYYNTYSDCDNVNNMEKFNLAKIDFYNQNKVKLRQSEFFFKLSWTLTPNVHTVVRSIWPKSAKSLRTLADSADQFLQGFIDTAILDEKKSMVNILIADFFENSKVAYLSVNYNVKRFQKINHKRTQMKFPL